MTRKITTNRPTFSSLCGLTLLIGLIILPAASASAIVVTSMVGTESLVTDTDGTNTTNISNANGASFSSLINSAGSAGNGPNGTDNTDDAYDASRYNPQYVGKGSPVSFSSGGVDVSIAYAGPGNPGDKFVEGPIDFDLTFNYGPITDTITSATFSMDITDDDFSMLTFTTENGQNIGSTNTQGDTPGAPSGYWYAIDEGGNIDTTLTIALDADERTDLASGQYTLNGEWSVGAGGSDYLNGLFASNRAKLEIETIPEPSSMVLLTGALAACILLYRRRN